MSEYKLTQGIILLSNSDAWDEAKLEWELAEVYRQEDPETCLCGHSGIKEICVLHNKHNDNRAIVGNVCVKKFLGLPSDKIFQAIHRVTSDEEKALNAETIDHAHRHGWINNWERSFYFNTMRKRKLSPKELAKRLQVNRKVMCNIVKKPDR